MQRDELAVRRSLRDPAIASVLRKSAGLWSVAPLGHDTAANEMTEEAVANLERQLRGVIDDNDRYLWFAAVLIVLSFFFGVVGAFAFDDARWSAGAVAGSGLLSGGGVVWLIRMWQTKTATELLLFLATRMRGEALSTVIALLASAATDGRFSRRDGAGSYGSGHEQLERPGPSAVAPPDGGGTEAHDDS